MTDVFFILSKVVWSLLNPISMALMLLVLAVILLWLNKQKLARTLLTILAMLGLIIWIYPIGSAPLYALETRFPAPASLPASVDGIIVLGGAEQLKVSASWQRAEVNQAAERILASAELARLYPAVPVIYSGGSNLVQMPELPSESVIRDLYTQTGMDNARLVVEGRARNTAENFVLIQDLLPNPSGQYLLVTSAFHMPRSMGIARQHEMNVVPYPVDYRSHPATHRYADFDLFAHMEAIHIVWHEWLGLTAYYLTGKTASWLPKQNTTAPE
jgi:uncharacterized SAM-binding protein YcdF (DUF218 family)